MNLLVKYKDIVWRSLLKLKMWSYMKCLGKIRSKDLAAAEKLMKEQKNRTMAALQQYIKDSE